MSPEDGADEGASRRRLLEGSAGDLFREVVQRGLLPVDDPRLQRGDDAGTGAELLIDLGLLRRDDAAGGWVAVDPATVQPGVVAPLGRRAVELLGESAAWADVLGGLGQAFRRTPAGGSPLTEIRGLPGINRFLEAAVDDVESELLAAQPAGPRRAAVLEQAVDRDIRALQRGVRMRTLYQHTARRSKATREHVQRTMEHGAQVRTLDEFFDRLIVFDRQTAVIPGAASESALVIHEPGIVSYLADIFDRSWERGRDYEDRGETSESNVASEVRQLTVRMLTEGHSDPASAKRVGVSTRTYATYVAALKEEYGVETRFQLGFAMGSRAGGDDQGNPET